MYKSAKPDWEKRIEAACVIILCLSVFVRIVLNKPGSLDEIWNYNICRAFAMGYVPYRDMPLVQAPLFFFIFSIPLRICRLLIVYRIFLALAAALTVFVTYIYSRMYIGNCVSLIPTAFLALFLDHFTYNSLLYLIILSTCIVYNTKWKYRYIMTGFLCFLGVLSRQTSGTLFLLGESVYVIFDILRNEEHKKRRIIELLAGESITGVVFLIVLLMTSSFSQFWECCLFSLFSFGENNSLFPAVWGIITIIFIIAGIVTDIFYIKEGKKGKQVNYLIALICLASIGIPIFEPFQHLLYAMSFSLIPVAMKILGEKKSGKKFEKKIEKVLIYIVSAEVAVFIFTFSIKSFSAGEILHDTEFSGVAAKNLVETYGKIAEKNREYEADGYEVVTISASAAIVSILNNRYTPVYDLFLNGNLGLKKPEDYIDDLLKKDKVIIVIPEDYETENWQNPEGIPERIDNSCEKTDSVGRFGYYRKPEK